MDDFLSKLAEILDVEKVQASDVLANFPEWDSLSVLSAIAMIHGDYGVILTNGEIRKIATAQEFYDSVISKSPK